MAAGSDSIAWLTPRRGHSFTQGHRSEQAAQGGTVLKVSSQWCLGEEPGYDVAAWKGRGKVEFAMKIFLQTCHVVSVYSTVSCRSAKAGQLVFMSRGACCSCVLLQCGPGRCKPHRTEELLRTATRATHESLCGNVGSPKPMQYCSQPFHLGAAVTCWYLLVSADTCPDEQ